MAAFVEECAVQRKQRFKIAEAAEKLGERADSIRKVLERRFRDEGIVRAVREEGSNKVEYEVADDAVARLRRMMPKVFPLRQHSERGAAARRVVLHLRALEEGLGSDQPDLAQQAAMLDAVGDTLERDLMSDDATAEVEPGRVVRRPYLVVWFLLQQAVHRLLLNRRPEFEKIWQAVEDNLTELRGLGPPHTSVLEMSFIQDRFVVAKTRVDCLSDRAPDPSIVPPALRPRAHVSNAFRPARAVASIASTAQSASSVTANRVQEKRKAAALKKGVDLWPARI